MWIFTCCMCCSLNRYHCWKCCLFKITRMETYCRGRLHAHFLCPLAFKFKCSSSVFVIPANKKTAGWKPFLKRPGLRQPGWLWGSAAWRPGRGGSSCWLKSTPRGTRLYGDTVRNTAAAAPVSPTRMPAVQLLRIIEDLRLRLSSSGV